MSYYISGDSAVTSAKETLNLWRDFFFSDSDDDDKWYKAKCRLSRLIIRKWEGEGSNVTLSSSGLSR